MSFPGCREKPSTFLLIPSVRRPVDSSGGSSSETTCLLWSPKPQPKRINNHLSTSGGAALPWPIHRPLRALLALSPQRKSRVLASIFTLLRVMGSTAGQWETIKPMEWQWWAEHTVETLLKCEQQEHPLGPDSLVWLTFRHYLASKATLSFSCCSLITFLLWISPVNRFCIMNEIILHYGSLLTTSFDMSVFAAALFVH